MKKKDSKKRRKESEKEKRSLKKRKGSLKSKEGTQKDLKGRKSDGVEEILESVDDKQEIKEEREDGKGGEGFDGIGLIVSQQIKIPDQQVKVSRINEQRGRGLKEIVIEEEVVDGLEEEFVEELFIEKDSREEKGFVGDFYGGKGEFYSTKKESGNEMYETRKEEGLDRREEYYGVRVKMKVFDEGKREFYELKKRTIDELEEKKYYAPGVFKGDKSEFLEEVEESSRKFYDID